MKFVLGDDREAAEIIAQSVNWALKKSRVLFLVSGGSNINLACSIRQKLDLQNKLTFGLIDERYGPVGHSDSNWQKLIQAGFDTSELNLLPVLSGLSLEETTSQYLRILSEALPDKALIGLFGMGTDGHTAGVFPNSPAVSAKEIVGSYPGNDFQRITITPAAFKLFDKAFLVAIGPNKLQQLQRLANKDIPVAEQPAQALKQAKELVIINDQIGERPTL